MIFLLILAKKKRKNKSDQHGNFGSPVLQTYLKNECDVDNRVGDVHISSNLPLCINFEERKCHVQRWKKGGNGKQCQKKADWMLDLIGVREWILCSLLSLS